MAHIPDGIASTDMLTLGAVGSAIAIGYGLKKMDVDQIPQTAMLAAVFFISSMITFPVGPSSVHLLFNGLMGLMLGWSAIPAIFIALLLQLLFFGYGGLLVLGLNTFNMAIPAIIVAITLRPLLLQQLAKPEGISKRAASAIGATAGAIGIGLTTSLLTLSLAISGEEFIPMVKVILATNIPLLLIESVVSASIVGFLVKASPNTFSASMSS